LDPFSANVFSIPDLSTIGQNDAFNPSVDWDIFKGLEFYCWNTTKLGIDSCCYTHLIGLPRDKNNVEHPLYDYEKNIIDILEKNKHLWVLKATGLGISELLLRMMSWLCVKDNKLVGSQMCIVTGPRIDLAITLIDRMKRLFYTNEALGIKFNTRETIVKLNDVTITAYPSNHLDSMRGIKNVSFILLDEGDFFPVGEQQDARDVSERYIGKSNPYICMISTPNAPGMLFENISREPEETCLYKRLKLDYTYGIGKIYSSEDLIKAKRSPSWEREYCLKFLGLIGNVFSPLQVDSCVKLGEQYKSLPINNFVSHSLGLDPGFSSSRTALCLIEHLEEFDKVIVRHSEELEGHPSPSEIVNKVFKLVRATPNTWVYVEGSARSLITELKIAFNENINYTKAEDVTLHNNRIIPVNFVQEHKPLLQNLYSLVSNEYLCIPQSMEKVIISLKSAIANEYSLDKNQSSYNDTLDALRLACRPFHFD
jgi:hypothetical protein